LNQVLTKHFSDALFSINKVHSSASDSSKNLILLPFQLALPVIKPAKVRNPFSAVPIVPSIRRKKAGRNKVTSFMDDKLKFI